MSIFERAKRVWNAFIGRDPTYPRAYPSYGYSGRPDRYHMSTANARSVVASIYNRIAIYVSSIDINHVRVDKNGSFIEVIDDSLNDVFAFSANIDQTGRELIKDAVLMMFDEGAVAFVPVVTDVDPNENDTFKVYEVRIGKVINWFPHQVLVEVFNESKGYYENFLLEKRCVPIVENPFYPVMNEMNSTYKRLGHLWNQIDEMNSNNSSGRLDLLIQLPYPTRNEVKRADAEIRKKEIEAQLNGAHGIAYIDSTEKVIQLNRPVENTLWEQAKDLTVQLMNQLGFSEAIFNGTADESIILTFFNQTIEPILTSFVENIQRKWLTKTALTQGQRIHYHQNPFKLVPVGNIAEIADKFTRNEILTSNEIRGIIGFRPSDDPKANMLINSNLNQSKESIAQINRERAEENN